MAIIIGQDRTHWGKQGGVYTTASGRYIYRHASQQGSVIVFNMFGYTTYMMVLDAIYRCQVAGPWLTTSAPSFRPTANVNGEAKMWSESMYKDGETRNSSNYPITDAQLQALWTNWYTTDNVGSYLGMSCFNATSSGWQLNVGDWDLYYPPNMYEAMVLRIECDYFDALDPTANTYPQGRMGNNNPRGAFGTGCNGALWTGEALALANDGTIYQFGAYIGLTHIPTREFIFQAAS